MTSANVYHHPQEYDKDALKVTFDRVPEREELDPEFKEQLVIEYYSKQADRREKYGIKN